MQIFAIIIALIINDLIQSKTVLPRSWLHSLQVLGLEHPISSSVVTIYSRAQ